MDTSDILALARRLHLEPPDVEVRAAVGDLPSTVVETISAFSNGAGGTLLLGVDESDGFSPAQGFDASRIRDALAGACADKLTPPCRAPIQLDEREGATVVRLDVPALDPVEKPCYVTARGAYGGSFLRGGDGDRRLTHYEVTQLLSSRTQPVHDREVVEAATPADLDPALLAGYLSRIRQGTPAFRRADDERVLLRAGVLGRAADGSARPTLAGLVALGEYPQEFFPQLFVSFVVLPATRMGETAPDGRRFEDNRSLRGSIPAIVADAVDTARRNMRVGAIVRGAGREDRYDFPVDVVRELVVNALMHRDYSPDSRGTQVQVELYPDRLVVKNPGGLHGSVTVADLGADDAQTSSRNQTLAALLADVTLADLPTQAVCENRGSGIPSVMAELRRVGMSPPTYDVTPARVAVTVPQHALVGPDTARWIGSLGQHGLSDAQQLALAMVRSTGQVTDAMLQAWGVDRLTAGEALKDLVARGLVARGGGRRHATYRMLPTAPDPAGHVPAPASSQDDGDRPAPSGIDAEVQATYQAIRAGFVTRQALLDRLGLAPRTLARRLEVLVRDGLVERTGPGSSSRQSYRPVAPRDQG